MIKRNKIYVLLISIGLLLFTQTVIPYLHNHTERHFGHGIVEDHGDSCSICLDIVPALFILPSVFYVVWVALVFGFRNAPVLPYYFYALPIGKGRAPPLV